MSTCETPLRWSILPVMNCPSCGAPLRLEEEKDFLCCDYCRNILYPEKNEEGVRVLSEESKLQCPVCAVALAHASLGGHRILYCQRCRGMLTLMERFMALAAALRAGQTDGIPQAPARPEEFQRHTFCPQCHHEMDTHFYGGPGNVVIDSCSPCHMIWLDYHELLRIIRSPDYLHPERVLD